MRTESGAEMNAAKRILSRLVRIGIVMNVDRESRKVRVKFDDEDITSGWLRVLDNRPFIPDYDVEQVTGTRSGGGGLAAYEEHDHPLIIKPWMPKINDAVLCLFLPTDDSDGYVLGGI